MDRVARLETFARAGYLARGIVYILLGYFALTTAGGEDASGVFRQIADAPAGSVLLTLVGLGLAGYGIFRLYGAATDIQGDGDDAKGAAKRIGHAASGLAHLVLCYFALKLAFGSGGGGGGSGGSEAAGQTASFPGGEVLLAIIGFGFLAAALAQLAKAATGKFMRLLDADAPSWTEYLGRAGYAARGIVFGVIGWQLVATPLGSGDGRIGVEPALASLRDTQWLFILVAIGLLLFGIFSLIMARYRRIRDENVIRRLRSKAAAAAR